MTRPLGDRLVAAMQEAVAIHEGTLAPARQYTLSRTMVTVHFPLEARWRRRVYCWLGRRLGFRIAPVEVHN